MNILSKNYSMGDVKNVVGNSGHSGMLGILGHGIPLSFNSSMSAAGLCSFEAKRDEKGNVVDIRNMRIEINPSRANLAQAASTLVHELKHAEDLSGNWRNFKESDRGALEARAEGEQASFISGIAKGLGR
jgi:hypothetical protein